MGGRSSHVLINDERLGVMTNLTALSMLESDFDLQIKDMKKMMIEINSNAFQMGKLLFFC